MKNIKKIILGLGAVLLLTACGGNKGGGTDENQTNPEPTPPTTEQVLPTCSITEGVPLTDSQLTVHIKCKGGNINIDQATVVVDGQLKNVDISGANIDDYIGFRHLQDNKVYKAKLEVVVGGETLTDSVSIRTKKTPEPEPSPEPNKAPVANAGSDVSVEAGKSVKLDGSKSSDADGTIVYYTWYDENGDVLSTDKAFNFSSNEVKKHIIRLKVTDDDGAKASDTVVVTVTEKPTPNTPPKANNLTVDAQGEGTVSGTIVISDKEDKISDLKVVVKDAPTHGTIVWNSKTKFTYTVTAASGYAGNDKFTYYVKDSKGLKSTIKTVTILDVIDS